MENQKICIGCAEYIHPDYQAANFKQTTCCDNCAAKHYDNIEFLANEAIKPSLLEISELTLTQFETLLTLHRFNSECKPSNFVSFYKWIIPATPKPSDFECLGELFNKYFYPKLF